MSEDNSLNLRSRVVLRHIGNDQYRNIGHADDPLLTLPEVPETSERSAPQEPTLAQILGQMARVIDNIERTQESPERNRQA